jgi:hypothetical protein
LIPADMIYEPYTGNRLNLMPDGSTFLELTRGCPYKCSYCFYSKNYSCIREIPFLRLIEALRDGSGIRNLREIYVLSPALNIIKNFSRNLETLASLDHGIRLHSEIRAETIDQKRAALLYKAGFRSMEVGLQTLNIDSLKKVGRRSKPEKELEGMQNLKKSGISVKIGLIPGLPHDTRESFMNMIDRLITMGFQEDIELYPLMVLPGTAIRDKAVQDDINFLHKPPYYYHQGWGITFDDLRDITRYVEETTGLTHIVRKLPDFNIEEQGGYCRGLRINGDAYQNWNLNAMKQKIDTNVFSLYISFSDSQSINHLLPLLLNIMTDNELYNIVFINNNKLNEDTILRFIETFDTDNLYRRIHIFHDLVDGLRVRFFQVFGDIGNYSRAKQSYSIITPVLRIGAPNSKDLTKIEDREDNILIARGAYEYVKNDMKKFSEAVESVGFEAAIEQEQFYESIGYDYIKLPFQFRVVTL